MRVAVDGKVLKEATLLANIAAKSKSNISESQCVLFECRDGSLRLAATDMWKVFVECFHRPAACHEGGSVAIAAKPLKALVKETKSHDEVELERVGDYEVVARWGNGREMSLFARPADEFPTVNTEKLDDAPSFFLGTGETLSDALKRVGFAAADDTFRYGVLAGVHFRCDGNEAHVVATDTRILSLYRYPLAAPPFGFTIPTYTAKVASKLFGGASVVDARVTDSIVEFSILRRPLSWKLYINTIEGNYPNYMRVVDFHSGNPYAVKFPVLDLQQVVGDKEVEKIVFEFSPPEAQAKVTTLITSQSTGWTVKATVNIQVEWVSMPDKPIVIALNPRYIADFIKAADSSYVAMRFGKPNAATEWQVGQDYWQVLIMPMEVSC